MAYDPVGAMTDETPTPPAPPRSALILRLAGLLVVSGIAGLEFFRPSPDTTQVLALLATVLAILFGPAAVKDMWPGR